jgi:hypothetical protein
MSKKLFDIYTSETGLKCPSGQIEYEHWLQGYHSWLERTVSIAILSREAQAGILAALKELVHLHLCEQEGLSSGMPTKQQWLEAVDAASEAIRKAEGGNP